MDDHLWLDCNVGQRSVMITCLLSATHKEKEWMWQGSEYKVEPGQFITSVAILAKESKCTPKAVRCCLRKFEKNGFLVTQKGNRFRHDGTLITIINWHTYQSEEEKEKGQGANERANEGQMKGNYQECKEVEPSLGSKDLETEIKTLKPAEKKTKKRSAVEKVNSFTPPEWVPSDAWKNFDDMRRSKDQKSWTQGAKELAVKTLEKLARSGFDPEEVLNQSTLNGWKGLFPVKDGGIGGGQGGDGRMMGIREKVNRGSVDAFLKGEF